MPSWFFFFPCFLFKEQPPVPSFPLSLFPTLFLRRSFPPIVPSLFLFSRTVIYGKILCSGSRSLQKRNFFLSPRVCSPPTCSVSVVPVNLLGFFLAIVVDLPWPGTPFLPVLFFFPYPPRSPHLPLEKVWVFVFSFCDMLFLRVWWFPSRFVCTRIAGFFLSNSNALCFAGVCFFPFFQGFHFLSPF